MRREIRRDDTAVVRELSLDEARGHVEIVEGEADLVVAAGDLDIRRDVRRHVVEEFLQDARGDDDFDVADALVKGLRLDGEAVCVCRGHRDLVLSDL